MASGNYFLIKWHNANSMSDHILFNTNNAPIDCDIHLEHHFSLVFLELAVGDWSFSVHIEEQQRTVQVTSGWR